MANDVKLKIGADTTELERAFGALIRKIQSDADKLKVAPSAKNTQTASVQTERELSKNKSFTDAQAKSYEKILKSLKEEHALLQQIGRERERQARQEQISNIQKSTFTQVQRGRDWAIAGGGFAGMPPGSGGGGATPPSGGSAAGFNMPRGGITNASSAASALGVSSSVIGGIASVIAGVVAAEGARVLVSQSGLRASSAQAQAFNTMGQGGQLYESAINGGGLRDLMFSGERGQAAGIAQKTMEDNLRWYNRAGRMLTHPYELGQGALKYLSYVPATAGIIRATGLNTSLDKEVEERRKLEQAEIQDQQEFALEQGEGRKVLTGAKEKYLRDWRRNLDFQRKTGYSEEEFRKFLGGINGAGFSDELGMGAASSIIGAGGSTRAARGNAGFALQMGRQFDLTNAGQAIGAISGQLGGTQQSKDALIAIQAEGTRIGVNRSDMREENRKFVEMAANVINQSSATGSADVDQLVSTFSKFMSNTSMTGLQAGQNAYETFQKQSNVQGGPSAVMRWAGMRRNPVLGQLSTYEQSILNTMPANEVIAGNETIQDIANKHGLTADDIVKNYNGVIKESMFVNPMTDKAIQRLSNAIRAKNGPHRNRYQQEQDEKEYNLALGGAAGSETVEGATAGLDLKARKSYALFMASGETDKAQQFLEQEKVRQTAEGKGTPRGGDQEERGEAEVSRMSNEIFTTLKTNIETAATTTDKFAESVNRLVAAVKGGNPAEIAAAMKGLGSNAPAPTQPVDQTQTSSGGVPVPSYMGWGH